MTVPENKYRIIGTQTTAYFDFYTPYLSEDSGGDFKQHHTLMAAEARVKRYGGRVWEKIK